MTESPNTDLSNANAIVGAAEWVQHGLLGTAATVIATIAVASLGLAMLFGYVSVRRGTTVVLGCVILFAAPTIAMALRNLASEGDAEPAEQAVQPIEPLVGKDASMSAYYDPYAGPSVPSD